MTTKILTYLLMFILCEELIKMINLLPFPIHPVTRAGTRHHLRERFGGLRMIEHQLGVQKALDEPDAAFLSNIGGKLIPNCIA